MQDCKLLTNTPITQQSELFDLSPTFLIVGWDYLTAVRQRDCRLWSP